MHVNIITIYNQNQKPNQNLFAQTYHVYM